MKKKSDVDDRSISFLWLWWSLYSYKMLCKICALDMLYDSSWKSLREVLEETSGIDFCQHHNCCLFLQLTQYEDNYIISNMLKAALK